MTDTSAIKVLLQVGGVNNVEVAFNRVRSAASGMASGVGKLLAFAGVAGGIYAIGDAMSSVVRKGVGFNSTLEQAKLGIAAAQKQLNPGAFKTFDDALETAGTLIDLLKQKAKESPASFSELVAGFQAVTGAATEGGVALTDQVDLVVMMSQALSGLGIQSDQLLQETRALITGTIDKNALAAKTLGITREEIMLAREQGQLYEFLSSRLSAFAEAGKRGQSTFRTLASNIGDAAEQAAGIAFEPIFEALKRMMEDISGFDFEGMAKRVAAFFDAAMASWRDGTFGEFVGLSIEAGFENGFAAAQKIGQMYFGWLATDGLAIVGNNIASLASGLTKGVLSSLATIGTAVNTLFIRIAEEITVIVAKGVNFLWVQIREKINAITAASNTLFGTKIGSVSGGEIDTDKVRGFFAQGELANQEIGEKMKALMTTGVNAMADLLRPGSPMGLVMSGDATKRLGELLDKYQKLRDAAKPQAGSVPPIIPTKEQVRDVAKEMRELERALRDYQNELSGKRAMIDGSFTMTEASKFMVRRDLLRQELETYKAIVATLEERARLETDDKNRELILSRLDTARRGQQGAQNSLAGIGADPNSLTEQMQSGMTRLMDSWGTFQQQIASTSFDALNNGLNATAEGLTRMIFLTKDWRSILNQIPLMIGMQIVQAIIKMGLQWVATQVMMAIAGKSIQATATATTAPIAAAQSAIWATPATLATIASYGSAAAAAPGFIAAAQGITMAQSLAMFREGGYTGNIGEDEIAGLVHGREFVMPADVTAAIGPDRLQGMVDSTRNPVSRGGGASPLQRDGGGRSETFVFMDLDSAMDAYMASTAAEKKLMRMVNGRAVELGVRR